MSVVARISIATTAVLAVVGITILMTLYTWFALTLCGAACLGLGYAVYDFISLRAKD
jgi:hypothetical protein